MLRRVIVGAVALGALLAPTAVSGQAVRDQIRALFTFGPCGDLLCLAKVGGNHGDHFDVSAEHAGEALIAFVGSSIGLRVSNTPISSSSSGTTFKFEGGTPVKLSTSAGPILAERSQTLGGKRSFLGLDVTQMTFHDLRGIPLNALNFNYAHQDDGDGILGDSSFENDFVSVKMAMDLNLLVSSFSFTYGLADGVDLGITVPFVRLSIHGNSVAQIVTEDTLHHFSDSASTPNSRITAVASADGVATGIGDIEAHLKINLGEGERLGIALFVSARLPTGDTTNFLGSGAFSGRGLGILSARFGDFNPHLNLGYTIRDAATQNNSVDAALGFDELLSPWATIALDVLGDWELGASRLRVPRPVQYLAPYPHALDVTNIPNRRDDFISLNTGFKFRTKRGIQIVTNALIPLRYSALQPTIAWTGGVEYTF